MHIALHNFRLCLSSNKKQICQNIDLTCILETLLTNNDTIGIPQASTLSVGSLTDKLFSFEYVFVLFTYQTWHLCVPSNEITVQLSGSMWDISEAQLKLLVVKVNWPQPVVGIATLYGRRIYSICDDF